MEAEAKSTLPATTKQPPQLTAAKKSFITSLMEATGSSSFHRAPSFKEDSYFSSQLKPHQAKALKQLKHKLIQHHSSATADGGEALASYSPTMWNVSLLSPTDPRADVILLKFLRARDFKVEDSYEMLQKCLAWRHQFGADGILSEDTSEFKEVEGVVAYLHGSDRTGHPVCYNFYGVFKDKSMFDKYIGDGGDGGGDEKLQKFLRWRVQVLERSIKMLELKPGGVNSIIQVTDLKDMPKSKLRVVSNHILSLFQDNYPEMVARKIFINVPWYFSFLYSMFSPFLTKRTKSKFVISKEGDVAETLYKFIRPEDIPVQYGGLSRPDDRLVGGPPKPASELSVKGGEKVNIQIEGVEEGATVSWELVVGGWELVYSAEFVPNAAEHSYIVAVEKPRLVSDDEGTVRNSYYTAGEAGKLVLCVDNTASRKKKVAAYRYVVSKSSSLVCV